MSTTARRRPAKQQADAAPPNLIPVPTFDQAHPPASLPAETGEDVLTSSPRLGSPVDFSPLSADGPTAPGADTRTGISSAGTTPVSPAEARRNTGRLLGVVVAIAFGFAARALYRAGRQLRQPTREQIREFADPLAAIAVRHFDVSRLNADLEDGVTAIGVAGEWALEGPIAPRIYPVAQVGMETADDPTPVTPAAPDVWHQATRDPDVVVRFQE